MPIVKDVVISFLQEKTGEVLVRIRTWFPFSRFLAVAVNLECEEDGEILTKNIQIGYGLSSPNFIDFGVKKERLEKYPGSRTFDPAWFLLAVVQKAPPSKSKGNLDNKKSPAP